LRIIVVERERSFTKGYVTTIKYPSIGTQKRANRSGLFIASVFGTNSQITIEKYVIVAIERLMAISSAYGAKETKYGTITAAMAVQP